MADTALQSDTNRQRPRARENAAPKAPTRRGLWPLYLALALQFTGALFFIGELWIATQGASAIRVAPEIRNFIQMLAGLALAVGVFTSIFFLRHSLERVADMSRQIDVVAGNFEDHLKAYFRTWDLSPSEQSVAIYAMKGFSNAEVANLRGTSASTIKSQMNAIYRKSGFANRQQLISFLVEELLAGVADPDQRTLPDA
ncbi:MAG: helix-turn-helix transcriptional regulator [Pseudomonadota bacterium]